MRRIVLALVLLLPSTAALAERPPDPGDDRTLSPYFFVEGGDPAVDRLPLRGTAVSVHIAGVIADVTVEQTYRNDGTRPINARYVFPGSTRAAVHGLEMTVGDEVIVAKIKERQEARREFEAAKEAGKNASLLEQDRPNVFSMNVANVMPGQTIAVKLRYSELLVPENGVYEFVYPTVVGPRYSSEPAHAASPADSFIRTPYLRATELPTSTLALAASVHGGVPVRELQSPTHRIAASPSPDGTRVAAFLVPGEARGGDRDFVLRWRLAGDAVATGLILEEGKDENFFLLVAQPPARVTPEAIPPREYVFILDVSGSMDGFPLDTAKDLMAELVVRLRPTDTCNVMLFAGDARMLSPISLAATPDNITLAVAMVDAQRGGGGTELLGAMQQALGLPRDPGRSRTFVVVTDGYIGGEKELFEHIGANLGDANVFAFGIGSSVNRYLIEGVARAGQGEPFVVIEAAKAGEAALRFREYIESPVLTRVRLEAQGFEIYDVEPASIPDVFADRPVVVHGKWRGPRSGKLTVTGVGGAGAYRASFDVAGVNPGKPGALRQLWARTRIAALSDWSFGREDDETHAAIVSLGLRYNLLTRHTSFIAVRHKIVNEGTPATNVEQPLPLPLGVSEQAVPLEQGDEPGLVALLLAMVAASALVLRRRRMTRAL